MNTSLVTRTSKRGRQPLAEPTTNVLAQIYTRQVYELDDEVRNLKREGHTGATRSGLLRLAVELLLAMDIQSFYGHEATE